MQKDCWSNDQANMALGEVALMAREETVDDSGWWCQMINQIEEEEEMWRAKANELFNLEGWGDDSSVDDEASDDDDECLSLPSLETDDPFLRIDSDAEEEKDQEESVATDDSDSTGLPMLIPRPAAFG